MSERRWCRICGGEVVDPDAWVDLDRLGRFWLCPRHVGTASFVATENVGWLYVAEGHRPLVLGPYFGGTVTCQVGVGVEQVPRGWEGLAGGA